MESLLSFLSQYLVGWIMKAYMGITCKAGAYNETLQGLMNLNIPERDIFLLFGPVDILVQFKDMADLSEFKQKWFDPVRLRCCKEGHVKKTMTFVVIQEGLRYEEEPYAFVFLNVQSHLLEKAQEELVKIPKIISADIVLGSYDIISSIRAESHAVLEQLISNIQKTVPGIEGTATTIVSGIRI